jgi:hypothetical protein
VIGFLRFVGVMNAAIWLGAAIVFTVSIGPAFVSPDMLSLMGRPRAGVAVELILQRYYLLQHWCGAIAIAHLVVEWLYTGRPLQKFILYLLAGLFILGLMGGWLQPRLLQLHLTIYGVHPPAPALVERARQAFHSWHLVAEGIDLIVIAGLVYYLWRMTNLASPPRFLTPSRFRLD